jgi:hypothetical protein
LCGVLRQLGEERWVMHGLFWLLSYATCEHKAYRCLRIENSHGKSAGSAKARVQAS